MAKRRYPFEDLDEQRRHKIQIVNKEGNSSMDIDSTPFDYEKTFGLLFLGSKSEMQNTENEKTQASKICTAVAEQKQFKQMCLTANGKLFLNGVAEPSELASKSPLVCSACSGQTVKEDKCFFCDKCICSYCTEFCFRCEEMFCKLCAVKMYQQQESTAICLTCLSSRA